MQIRSLGTVALKTWAVILLVSGVLSIGTLLSQLAAPAAGGERRLWVVATIWNAGYLVLSLIAAVLLLKYADRVAEKLYTPEETTLPFEALQLEQVAYGTLGVYFLVKGVRAVAAAAFQLATRPALETETVSYLWRNQPGVIVDGTVEFAAGLILLLGRRGLAAAFSRLRGYSKSSSGNGDSAA
jgi:hypothetical protein